MNRLKDDSEGYRFRMKQVATRFLQHGELSPAGDMMVLKAEDGNVDNRIFKEKSMLKLSLPNAGYAIDRGEATTESLVPMVTEALSLAHGDQFSPDAGVVRKIINHTLHGVCIEPVRDEPGLALYFHLDRLEGYAAQKYTEVHDRNNLYGSKN